MNIIRNNFVVNFTLPSPANIYPVSNEITGVMTGLFISYS